MPVPDPTLLTTEQLLRAVAAERDYTDGQIAKLEERLHAIDRATELLNETVNRTPTEIQKEVAHLRELMAKEIDGIRTELESQSKLGKERLEGIQRETKLAADASERAIAKAETANEKRFEALNEFRASLSDQTSSFLPREVAEAQFAEVRRSIAELTERLAKLDKAL